MKARSFIVYLLLSCLSPLFAQTISGRVLDATTGEPLAGANVLSNNGQGVTTDSNGDFNLNITSPKTILTLSFIGYETQKSDTLSVPSISLIFRLKPTTANLGEVVVSSGRFEQRLEEVTVSLDVMKPGLLEDKNLVQIEDALQQAPGVNVTEGQANIRGGSGWSYGAGTRVQTLVDGMPLISGDANQAQWSLVPVYSIQQIEVLKGASSVLYGSAALNGVINVLTSAFPEKDAFTANLYSGFYDSPEQKSLKWWSSPQYNSGMNFNWEHRINDRQALVLSGGQLFDEGFRYLGNENRSRLFGKYFFRPKKIKGLELQLAANAMYSDKGNSLLWENDSLGYIPADSNITRSYGWDYYIDPTVTYRHGVLKHTLQGRYLKINNNVFSSTENYSNRSDYGFDQYYLQYFGKKSLVVTAGISSNFTTSHSILFVGKHQTRNNALFLQGDMKPLPWLNLSAGIRYENYFLDNHFFEKPVFRGGANIKLDKGLNLRFSYGEGFRYPSVAEAFTQTSAGNIVVYPNPDLKPETGNSMEAGLRQMFISKKVKGYADFAVFRMRYDNMMEYTAAFWGGPNAPFFGLGFRDINIGETNIYGAEVVFNLQGVLSEKSSYRLLAGYTYTKPTIVNPVYAFAYDNAQPSSNPLTYEKSSSDSLDILKYRYQHLLKFDGQLNLHHFEIGASLRYNDFMQNIDRVFEQLIPGVADFRKAHHNGDLVIDARAGYTFSKSWRLDFLVQNALNREVMIRPAYLDQPRSYSIRVQYSL